MICSVISYLLSGLYYHIYLDFEPRAYALSVLFASPIFIFSALFNAAIIHPFVRLNQGLGNAGFEATFRIMCYSSGVLLLDWAFTGGPGDLLYFFLTFFLIVVGLRQVHQTSTVTATFFTFAPWFLVLFVTSIVGDVILKLGGEGFMRDVERFLQLTGII